MADAEHITLADGNTYNFKDAQARKMVWSGTQAEYAIAVASGLIADGTIVNITDDGIDGVVFVEGVDSSPTSGSTNLVTSGGVYDALDNIMSDTTYSTTTAYKLGDVVTYSGVFYICTTACSANTWATNSSCFTESTLLAAHNELNANLNEVDAKIISETYTNLASNGNANFNICKSGYRLIDFYVTSTNPAVNGVCTCVLSCGYGFVYNNDNTGNTFTRIPLSSKISGVATFIKA